MLDCHMFPSGTSMFLVDLSWTIFVHVNINTPTPLLLCAGYNSSYAWKGPLSSGADSDVDIRGAASDD